MKINDKFFYVITIIISVIGFIGGLSVSYKQFMNISACPNIGFIPVCYIVALGYLLMIVGTLRYKWAVFLVGWLPVFVLALFGTTQEIQGNKVCPTSDAGVPMCYYSLIMVLAIGLSFIFWQRYVNLKNNK